MTLTEVEVQAQCSCGGRECGGWQLLDRIGRAWPSGPLLSEFCAGQHDVYGPAVEGWEPFTTEPQPAGYARGPGERPLLGDQPWPPAGRRLRWDMATPGDIRADLEESIRKLGGWTG